MAAKQALPLLNFHFSVEFFNVKYNADHQFSSVEGLHAQLVTDENDGTSKALFDTLILKRAYEPDSKLLKWCMDAINNLEIQEENLSVKLLNTKHEVICAWNIEKAVPISWSIAELNAEESQVLIETIVLKYDFFEVVNSKGEIVAPKPRPKPVP